MRKRIVFIHDEKNYSYLVSENDYEYEMPYVYTLFLKRFLREQQSSFEAPVDAWYNSLRGIEKKVVEKRPLMQQSLTA